MGVPRTYRKSGERPIVTYSHTAFITRTGFVNSYPYNTEDENIMQFNVINGKDTRLSAQSEANAIEFKLDFSSPEKLNGRCILVGASWFLNSYGSSQTCSSTAYWEIIKRTGAGDTSLMTKNKLWIDNTSVASGTLQKAVHFWSVDFDNISFNKGDQLILKHYQIISSQQGSVDGGIQLDTEEETDDQTKLVLPFKIQL